MEKCYEYLCCPEKDCIMYNRQDDIACWEVEGTLCNHSGIEYIREISVGKKKLACEHSACIYFLEARKRHLV